MDDRLSRDGVVYIKRPLYDIEASLGVIEEVVFKEEASLVDRYALRYAIVEIVESLAAISHCIARAMGYPLEGYVDSMRFFSRAGVLDRDVVEGLVRLVRLRNIIVHRYWEVDDRRVMEEARSGGLEVIKRAIDGIHRFIEG